MPPDIPHSSLATPTEPPLTELARFGPFFGLGTHAVVSGPWRPMTDLVDDPKVLAARINRVRQALSASAGGRAVDARVAASVTHLGLVARLVAPMIGAAALGRPVSWSLGDLAWRDELGGPYPLSVSARPVGGPAAVDALTDAGVRFGVSRKVLWGNVGSAVNSAAMQVRGARPELADAAQAAADGWLADPRIDGGMLRSGPGFRRTSCCLIYRLGDRSTCCGDCVLTR